MIKKSKQTITTSIASKVLSSKDLFKLINDEAILRKMTMREACVFLKSKGFKLTLDVDEKINLLAAYNYFHTYKKLEDYSLDELVKWRQTVRERLFENKKQNEILCKEYLEYIDKYTKNVQVLRSKRLKDMKWFDDVSKVIANRIKGMKTVEDMEL